MNRNVPRVHDWRLHRSHVLRLHPAHVVRSCLVSSCQRTRYLQPVSRNPGRGAASNALQELRAGVCGGEEKKKTKGDGGLAVR